MNTLTFTPELAYEDLLIFSKERKMITLKEALNAYIHISAIVETTSKEVIYSYVTAKMKMEMIEVLAIIHLIDNEDIILSTIDSYKNEITYIISELTKIDKSLNIECDKEVLNALKQTREKWLFTLTHRREELRIANNIKAMLTLLKIDSCNNTKS